MATMALTKSFKDLVQRRVADNPEFAEALLREGIDTMLAGDVETGKAVLRASSGGDVGVQGRHSETPNSGKTDMP